MKVEIKRRELEGYPYQRTHDVIADFMLFLYDFCDLFLVDWDKISANIKRNTIKLYVNKICDEYREISPDEKEWYFLDLCKYYNCD